MFAFVRSLSLGRVIVKPNLRPFCGRSKGVDIKNGRTDGNSEPRPLRVTLIEGHGWGPIVCASVRRIFKAADVPVVWIRHTVTMHRDPNTGRTAVNEDVVQSAAETGLVLRGPESNSAQDGSYGSVALALHKALNANVGVRLFASIEGHQPFGRIRIVNIRDNVSSEYSEIEHVVANGVVQSIKTVTQKKSEMVAKFAFDYALAHGHCRITALHKANVMRLSDGVFLRACRHVKDEYPDVDYCEEKLDKFCLRVVNDPGRYDVLLTPSLYGALASAACSTLAGGSATVPSASFGPGVAMFGTMGDDNTECEHYRQTDTNVNHDPVIDRYPVANPTGMIRSAAWMLGHAGMVGMGQKIDAALHYTIRQGVRTRDMGGTASCIQFTDAVIRNLLRSIDSCSAKN